MPFIGAAVGAVVGAIGSVVGAVGSFIGGLGFLGKLAIGIGLNLASAYLQRRKQQEPEPTGVKIQTEYGADVPRQVACGLVGVAGHEIHVNTYGGSDNKYLQDVYQLSDYLVTALTRIAINGEWVSVDTQNPHPERGWPVTSGEYAGMVWIKFYDGTQTTADFNLVDEANPAGRWTNDCIGVGCAYVVVTAEYDAEKTVGPPDMFFEYKGAPLYDPRKDDTVGGTGPHRWGDISTHEWTDNPIIIEYNYRRGFSINDDLFCGMEMDAGDLPLDKYVAAANVCDEIVNIVDDEKRYRCAIMLDCTATHGTNIEALMKSCGGTVIDAPDGSWPMVGAAQPVIATITDDDLVVGEPVSYQARRSMSELVNSISGTYPDADQLWSMVGYETIVLAAQQVVDRRTRDVPMDFPTVPSGRQAKQLASIYAAENRLEATAEITLRPAFRHLKAGDWITWESARYGTKTYLITESTLYALESTGPRNNRLALQERNASIYDGVIVPIPTFPFPPGKPAYLQEIDFQLVPVTAGAGDKLMPAIHVSWQAIEDVTVVGVTIEWWPTDQPAARGRMSVSSDTTFAVLTEGIVSSTEYQVRTKLITTPQRLITWSAPKVVTTVDQPYSDIAVYLANLQKEVRDYLQERQAEFDEVFDRLEYLAANVGSANVDDIVDRKRHEKQIGRNAASITRESVLRVEADEALASEILLVQANVDGNSAAILQEQTTRADADSALASDITAVQAIANNATAQGLMRWTASAGPGGAITRFTLQGKASAGNSYRTAGMYMDVYDTYSQIIMRADRFIVTDGTAQNLPLVYQNGQLKLGAVLVDWASINNAVVNNFVATNANIANLAVDTLKLAGNAINVTQSYFNASSTTITDGDTDEVASLVLNVPGDALLVRMVFSCSLSSGGGVSMFVNFKVDGQVIRQALPRTIGTQQAEAVWMTPSGGNHTFSVEINVGGGQRDASNRRLHVYAQRR